MLCDVRLTPECLTRKCNIHTSATATDPPGIYKVVTPKTHKLWEPLPAGVIYRINTGAPLPKGTDTVIMVEDTRLHSVFSAADVVIEVASVEVGEEKEVETLAQIPLGENVRLPGSDVKEGTLVMKKGERILSTGGEIGTLAFVGRKTVCGSIWWLRFVALKNYRWKCIRNQS